MGFYFLKQQHATQSNFKVDLLEMTKTDRMSEIQISLYNTILFFTPIQCQEICWF